MQSKRLTVVLILLGAVLITVGLFQLRGSQKSKRPTPPAPVVTVTPATLTHARAQIVAQGVVVAAQEVALASEVSGSVVHTADGLRPGGRFKKGQPVARVDDRDYRLTLQQAQAEARSADLQLRQEAERQGIAAREWKLITQGTATKAGQNDLALRGPQMEAARLKRDAAQGGVQRAQLNLARTTVRAPFNATVLRENVDVGQFVNRGTPIATLVGSDTYWITVSVPVADLALLNHDGASEATIIQRTGETTATRKGRVLEVHAQLDAQTRRAKITVAVDAPLEGPVPLLLGSFVTIQLEGALVEDVLVVPAAAVHERARIWFVDDAGKLDAHPIRPLWMNGEDMIIEGTVPVGTRMVTSPLAQPLRGRAVQVAESASP